MVMVMMAVFGTIVLLPIYMQNVQGLSHAAHRAAAAAGRALDGSARAAGRPVVRPLWSDAAGGPGRSTVSAVLWAMTLLGARQSRWVHPRRAPGVQRWPRLSVHAALHLRPGCRAAASLLARQRRARLHPAGGRGRRRGPAGERVQRARGRVVRVRVGRGGGRRRRRARRVRRGGGPVDGCGRRRAVRPTPEHDPAAGAAPAH